ncbi:MAG: hypothetical protein H0W84_05950, partial [Bacteroidetes bacterium]|nr:hypothetical protein [Bacteroidota bacterium]
MKKNLFFCVVFIFSFCVGLKAQVPAIFRVSEGVRPGGLISLYGEYFTGTVKVKFQETNSIVSPVQQDAGGQCIRVVMPAITPGAYTLEVSNDNGITWSNSVTLNKA